MSLQLPLQPEAFTPGYFESSGTVKVKSGEIIPFNTVCQDHLFYDESGKAIGSMFSYSYFSSLTVGG